MANRIESEDNNKLKLVRKLQIRKHRDAEAKFIIEGINLVEEAISKNADIDYIIISDDFDYDPTRLKLSDLSEVYEVRREIFERLADAENGSGVLAVVSKPKFSDEDLDRLANDANVLVLDRVQDPGNIGTMIRTAVAAGYSMVVCNKGTVDVWSPKVLRATAGMIFDIPVIYLEGTDELVRLLRRLDKRICVTVLEDAYAYYERDLSKGIALVIGNEGNGISDELIEMADERLTIPMKGNIESLNAAVSAAILMYEAIRR